ncbi:MAG: two-component system response regulator BtsR [Deltaproteobacteria bacterium]|nr:two-component system response regulator BtsR [Deltaproteobacteria bacterium]
MIRALLVDDEPLARDELAALLGETGQVEVVGSCGNAAEALPAIRQLRPDVLFLDIQMPAVSGFELLAMIDPEILPRVVFVTAHDGYAVKAFEESAADYLLKPVEKERLARTIARLREGTVGPAPLQLAAPVKRIPCLGHRAIKLVDVAEVEFVRSSEAGVYVVCPAGEFFTELTLKVLEERAGLVRCHKQYLVNIDRVDEISLGDNLLGVVRTKGGQEVPVSRRYLARLKERIGL